MATKSKSRWVCQGCGFQAAKQLGRCTECGAWTSFVEEIDLGKNDSVVARNRSAFAITSEEAPVLLNESLPDEKPRKVTGFESLDRVLGGGLVEGSVTLLAGDPGIGKSTLLLQLAAALASPDFPVMYVSAEESTSQVLLRARRLGLTDAPVLVYSEQNVTAIRKNLAQCGAKFAIIDSVQAIYHPELDSVPGSVSQVRESAAAIMAQAKAAGTATFLVGHVTKEGSIAGPRVLEHMVDAVLQFEGDRARQLRIVRSAKNRFGSTSEMAIFAMTEEGLREIKNPSSFFLSARLEKKQGERSPSGTSVIASCEGNRSVLLEVQALVCPSSIASPRRVAVGFEAGRLLQILAVLEKRLGLPLGKQDVYVNIAGGLECNDPGGDLGVAIAIATACMDRSVDPLLVCAGEIGLTGELRSVVSLERRLREAESLGFTKAIVPSSGFTKEQGGKLELIVAATLAEAVESAIPGLRRTSSNSFTSAQSTDRESSGQRRPVSAPSSEKPPPVSAKINEDEDFSPTPRGKVHDKDSATF